MKPTIPNPFRSDSVAARDPLRVQPRGTPGSTAAAQWRRRYVNPDRAPSAPRRSAQSIVALTPMQADLR